MQNEQIKQYHILARPRHLRHVFFVPGDYSNDKLLELMSKNQHFWGGVHNPIIPVKDDNITEEYANLLKYYDPDYVYYGPGISIDFLKRINYNPKAYKALHEPTEETVMGVDAYYRISRIPQSRKVLLPWQLYTLDSPLLAYYDLNFGLRNNAYNSDVESSAGCQRSMHFLIMGYARCAGNTMCPSQRMAIG